MNDTETRAKWRAAPGIDAAAWDDRRHAKLAILAIGLIGIDLRPGIVSIGPILPQIRSAFEMSHAQASLLTAIPDLLMGLLAFPTPWLARRLGRDRVIFAALILLCIAMLIRARATGLAGLLLSTAGVGSGIAIVGALMGGFVKASFPKNVALLIGFYATVLSLGSTVSAASTYPLAASLAGGWRSAAGLWSWLGIPAVFAWMLVSGHERKRPKTDKPPTAPAKAPLGNPTAWCIALFFACDNLLFYAFLSWTAPMYGEMGLSPTKSGLLLASFTATFMIANPIFGALSKSHDRRRWLAISGAFVVVGTAALAAAPKLAPFVWIPLIAFGLGGAFTLGMTLPLDHARDADEANTWTAFVLTIGYLIAASGPFVVGLLRDITGGFREATVILVLVGVAMLAITPFLRPHPQQV